MRWRHAAMNQDARRRAMAVPRPSSQWVHRVTTNGDLRLGGAFREAQTLTIAIT
jgi:hypothetical protein